MGAFDFLEKPVSEDRLLITLKNAIEKQILISERSYLIDEMNKEHSIIGNSPAIKTVFDLIDKAAKSDAKVFISGENGTGKELVARAIHFKSNRKNRPFVKVNCAALPEELIESELFGHVKGAFTGALSERTGRFEYANGGTIFLDEIGDISQKVQVKLLRVLQDNEIEKIGSNDIINVDVRLITATNKDINREIESGNFREDLFYRINIVNIEVPPLKKRKDDIPLFLEHFLSRNAEKHGVPKKILTDKAMTILINRDWKGNVREIENFVEKLTILIDDIYVSDKEIMSLFDVKNIDDKIDRMSLRTARARFEKEHIQVLLNLNNWNVSKTAEKLGVTRSYLYKKIELYDLSRPQ